MDDKHDIKVNLQNTVDDLSSRVRALEDELKKRVDQLLQLSIILGDCTKFSTAHYDDIHMRLENLETAVFPNLMRDLKNLHKIIGPSDGTAGRALDRRSSTDSSRK